MYTIVVDRGHARIAIEAGGRLTTAEALRAVSQAFALARADDLTRFLCDLRCVERGPGGLAEIAAAIAVHYRPGMRIAFIAAERQAPLVNRLRRFSGSPDGILVTASRQAATRWLHARRPRRSAPATPADPAEAATRAESAA